jgi:cardiolipin synthase C
MLLLGLSGGCASLPTLGERPASTALAPTADTRMGGEIERKNAQHPGLTGIYPLPDPVDAFAARIVLAAGAERSLDVQYYIWHGDTTGYLLFEALWKAGERGVRVRLLLDDNSTKGLDPTIAALDSHPNIEVRLFNPVVHRKHRIWGMLTDFSRLNRRMHNKSLTADNQAAIVGGRNIGDEYFAAGEGVAFADLDVVAIGTVVHDVSQQFDLYWASPSAYPANLFVPPADAATLAALQGKFRATHAAPEAQHYIAAIKASTLLEHIRAGDLPLEWCQAKAHYDDPAKILHPPEDEEFRMWPRLVASMGQPQRELDIVSPYFVPGTDGTAGLSAQARNGIQVRILTNSLAATDVSAVHAGYVKHRKQLLEAGVKLYELKPTAEQLTARKNKKEDKEPATGYGSSGASLHAKTFALDGERIFVGSFNMDPRSMALNTEMGILLQSPALAQSLQQAFVEKIPWLSYEVRLKTPDGGLEWIEHRPEGDRSFSKEPETGFFKRFSVGFLKLLPIDWLL